MLFLIGLAIAFIVGTLTGYGFCWMVFTIDATERLKDEEY